MDHNRRTVCRCCLKGNKKMKDMTNNQLVVDKEPKGTIICCYSSCSGVTVPQRSESSTFICKSCEKKLAVAFEFKEMCQESDQKLQEQAKALLATVKKESISDEEVESKPSIDDSCQTFNQVFLSEQAGPPSVLPIETIKIEDEPPQETEQKLEKKEIVEAVSEDDEPGGNDNYDPGDNDNYEPGNADDSSNEDEDRDEKKEEQQTPENLEVEEMNGKIICFQCDLVVNSIHAYKAHRTICTGNRYRQFCNICNQPVQRFCRHLEENHRDYKPFECGLCDAKFATLNNLRLHFYVHTKRKIFQCMASGCDSNFYTRKDLRIHVTHNIKHNINHYHCYACGSNFSKFLQLQKHCDLHKDDNTIIFANMPFVPCFKCKKLFVQRRNFFAHKCEPVTAVLKKWRTKKGTKLTLAKYKSFLATRWTEVVADTTPQTCDKCQKVFKNDDEFDCHRLSVCGEDPKFICPVCGKEFMNMQALKSHSDVHDDNRKFICDTCGISFAVKVSLAKHMLSHTIGRTFKCDQCSASFVDQNGLNTHMIVHLERKFECDICGHRFRTYDQIRQHMPVHSMELRKFACETCPKRFARRNELRKHIKHFHSGIKPLNCALCKRFFREPAGLKRHHYDRHSQITFECPHCSKVLMSRKGFTEHLFLHRGFHPFNCPECPRKFIKQIMFSKHLKSHNLKYNEKIHGYRETELNMKEMLAEAERRPNNADMNIVPLDIDIKNTPDPVESFAGTSNMPGNQDETVLWNMKNSSYGGYPQ